MTPELPKSDAAGSDPPTVVLNMIVRNEAHVIARGLQAAKPWIDAWAIVDTGSTDNTGQIIRDTLGDLPGVLESRPWVDFAHNRNEALELARSLGDYLLFLDADDTLEFAGAPVDKAMLTADGYTLSIRHGHQHYGRLALVRSQLPWFYEGVLHEQLRCAQTGLNLQPLPGAHIRYGADGARSQQPKKLKYLQDALTLEAALTKQPDYVRYWYFLGQSYRDAGVLEPALHAYDQRVAGKSEPQERFSAALEAARCAIRLRRDRAEITDRLLQAYALRPIRVEPLGELARYYRSVKQPALALPFLRQAMVVPVPNDSFYLERWWWRWGLAFEYTLCLAMLGQTAAAAKQAGALLAKPDLPDAARKILQPMKEQGAGTSAPGEAEAAQ